MSYVDGFVLPIHPDKLDAYREIARTFAAKAAELGGISVETLGDGLEQGNLTSFPRSVHAAEGENVVFSFVIWPDKATRDAGWEKIMGMPELQPQGDMPFDGKGMFWGGFTPLVGEEALSKLLATSRQPATAEA
ncbi:DUF1428 domain-containing protein [Sphingomonas glaciei]|uniref:DUF1428 domain-containing protein n=1 Tax=Sphingomonas glaciei TaxID=2938948 RepID=A0ABY5MSG7_9SPHN|nr:DUF1428 domain-containing protein [Sphingomonas glaciei]UUR07434.1 DUF1428 domain-containing protein [Sphingomonas glaciei]